MHTRKIKVFSAHEMANASLIIENYHVGEQVSIGQFDVNRANDDAPQPLNAPTTVVSFLV